jgi:DNA-binding MarR family transcriptional regulator
MHTSLDPDIDDCLAIRHATKQVSQLYERHLSPAGLTLAQFQILRALHRPTRSTMRELAHLTLTDRTTLVRSMKPLFTRGLIGSEFAPGPRRFHLLTLTEAGFAKLEEALPHWRNARASFERRFGEIQAEALRRELFRLKEELGKT